MRDRISHYFSYDGEAGLPEEGVADYQGRPHYFWLRESLGAPRTALFDVALIEADLLALVNELGNMWHEWDVAYHAGKVELHTHPMRAGSNERYLDLWHEIEQKALALRATSSRVIGVINTSPKYIEEMRPFNGKKWPAPGTYSPVLEVTWCQAA